MKINQKCLVLFCFFGLRLKNNNNHLLFLSPNAPTSSIWVQSLCLLSWTTESRVPVLWEADLSLVIWTPALLTLYSRMSLSHPATLGYLPPLVFSRNIAALILKNKPLPPPAAKTLRELAMLVLSGVPWRLSSPNSSLPSWLHQASRFIHLFVNDTPICHFCRPKSLESLYKLHLRSFLINSNSKRSFQPNPFPSSPPGSHSALGTLTSYHCHQNFLVKPNGWSIVWTFLI